MSEISQQGQKRVHLRKYYIPSGGNYDTNILMENLEGANILACKKIFLYCQFQISYYLLKCPKLGRQIPILITNHNNPGWLAYVQDIKLKIYQKIQAIYLLSLIDSHKYYTCKYSYTHSTYYFTKIIHDVKSFLFLFLT